MRLLATKTFAREMFVSSILVRSERRPAASPLNPTPSLRLNGRLRKESGVTLLMVAVGMFSFLAMLVLSLDVLNLYISKDQAQKTADAAALAGAEAIANRLLLWSP